LTGGASRVGCGAYHAGDGQRTLGAQTPLAALQLDLSVDHRRRPGLAERLDQPGDSGMPPPAVTMFSRRSVRRSGTESSQTLCWSKADSNCWSHLHRGHPYAMPSGCKSGSIPTPQPLSCALSQKAQMLPRYAVRIEDLGRGTSSRFRLRRLSARRAADAGRPLRHPDVSG